MEAVSRITFVAMYIYCLAQCYTWSSEEDKHGDNESTDPHINDHNICNNSKQQFLWIIDMKDSIKASLSLEMLMHRLVLPFISHPVSMLGLF